MIKFIEKNFVVIVLILAIFTFIRSCGDSRELSAIKKELSQLKDSTCTKSELRATNKILEVVKTDVRGFMETQGFIMNNFIDISVKNKANKEAWSMFSKQMEEQKKEKK